MSSESVGEKSSSSPLHAKYRRVHANMADISLTSTFASSSSVVPRSKAARINSSPLSGRSFLDLPVEVRHRIYELAVYDHDRGVVFLPRAVPRKVTPETDLDVKYACIFEDDDTASTQHIAWPVNVGASLSAGVWVDCATSCDYLTSHSDHNDCESDSDTSSLRSFIDVNGNEEVLNQVDAMQDSICGGKHEDEPCYCLCHLNDPDCIDTEDNCSDEVKQLCEETQQFPNNGLPSELGSTCITPWDERICKCDCHAEPIEHETPLVDDSDENDDTCDPDTDYDNHIDENESSDFDEDNLYDSEERLGMLYEPQEPPILLTCKEIRCECMSVYYSKNVFSWRFLYLDYSRSLDRYQKWVDTISPSNVELLTRLTLEGRHLVEEGVEFKVDIDLVPDSPTFDVKVTCEELDYATKPLQLALEKDLVWALWNASPRTQKAFKFSWSLLNELGEVFVKGMQPPADVSCDDAVPKESNRFEHLMRVMDFMKHADDD